VLKESENRPFLRGIYVEAALLGTALPTDCLEENGATCGTVKLKLSRNLLSFFDIEDAPEKERQIRLSVLANNGNSLALAYIFAETEGVQVIFSVRSLNQKNKDGSVREEERKLRVERQFSDGTGKINDIKSADKILQAYKEIISIWKTTAIERTEAPLLCGSCPAKVNGLPRTII